MFNAVLINLQAAFYADMVCNVYELLFCCALMYWKIVCTFFLV